MKAGNLIIVTELLNSLVDTNKLDVNDVNDIVKKVDIFTKLLKQHELEISNMVLELCAQTLDKLEDKLTSDEIDNLYIKVMDVRNKLTGSKDIEPLTKLL